MQPRRVIRLATALSLTAFALVLLLGLPQSAIPLRGASIGPATPILIVRPIVQNGAPAFMVTAALRGGIPATISVQSKGAAQSQTLLEFTGSGSVVHQPAGHGTWEYHLLGQKTQAPLVSVSASVPPPEDRLRFAGGTARRGMFSVETTSGAEYRLIVPVGQAVAGVASGPDAAVLEVSTGMVLEAVELRQLAGAPRQEGLGVNGVDGAELLVELPPRKDGPPGFVARLKQGDQSVTIPESGTVPVRVTVTPVAGPSE